MVSISQLEAAMELNKFCGQDLSSNGGDKKASPIGAHGGPSDRVQHTTGKVEDVLKRKGDDEEE